MNFRYLVENNILTAFIEGRLDTNNVEQLRSSIADIHENYKSMVIDLKHLDYVSSSGLRQFLALRKKFANGDDFKIINCSSFVWDIFHATGFDEIINVFQQNEEAVLKNLSFKDLLDYQVKNHGDDIFICDDKEQYSWKDIDDCSQVLANQLAAQGVRKNSHVGIYAQNSANWIISFFAIQKLGGIAMLINCGLAYKEVLSILKIGDITHLCIGDNAISQYGELKDRLTNDSETFTKMFVDISKSRQLKKEFMPEMGIYRYGAVFDNDDACVMIFSSGTTGKPKGILLSAYNILNSAETIADKIHMREDDIECLVLPLFHIFGFMACAMKCALYNARLIIPSDIHSKTVIDCIENNACTIFNCVPTTMLAIIKNEHFDADRLKTLRSTMLAGAPISESQLLNLMSELPYNSYSVAYGLSEMAPVSMTDYDDSLPHITRTVGKPVKDIEIRIYDHENDDDCVQGDGRFGEILVRGYNLMCAYYKRDIADQSVDQDDWLHTGDLGYIDNEGYLHIVGRIKDLIIRGGENIIPNEVATEILSHDNVLDAKVIGVPDDFYGEQVGACLILKDSSRWNEEEFVSFLKNRLAKYKVPVYFSLYSEYPLLANGKVDMLKLKDDLVQLSKKQNH